MVLPSELQLGCLRVGVVEKLALVDGAILSFFWVLWGILYPILVNIAGRLFGRNSTVPSMAS